MNINIFKPIFEALGLPYVGPYFTILLLCFLAAFPVTALLAPRFSLRPKRLILLTAVVIAASLVGSKLFHLLFDEQWPYYTGILRDNGIPAFFAAAFNPFNGGHVFYGGLAVGYGAGHLLARLVWREPSGHYADIAAFVLAYGVAFARIGCFLAGCCYGVPSATLGVSFPHFSIAAVELFHKGELSSLLEGTPPLFPAQLIESIATFAILIHLLFRLRDRDRLPPGAFMIRFLWLYAAFRFCIEFFRADMRGGLLFLSTSQWISLAILATLGIIRWRARSRMGLTGPTGLTIIAGAVALFSTTAWALPPEKKLHHYVARHWSVKEGLPHKEITAITRTADGLVWLATADGLVRFDGGLFSRFGREQIAGPGAAGFSPFDDRSFRYSGQTAGPIENAGPETLTTTDPTGRTLALSGTQVTFPEAERKETITFSQLTGKNPSAFLCDAQGALYIGTATGEILRLSGLEDTAGKSVRTADGIPITAFAADGPVIWAGTQGKGLLRIAQSGDVETFDERHGLSGLLIRALHRDRDGNLWVATEEGLDLFSDGTAVTLTTLDGLTSNLVYALIEDRTGALWIGTRGGGLNRYADGKFTSYTTKNGLPSDLIGGLTLDEEGTLWIGTTGGVTALRNGLPTSYTTKNGLSHDITGALLRDRDRRLWIGTVTGDINLLRSNKVVRVFPSQQSPATSMVTQIFEDRSGRLWVAAQYGLSLFNNGFIKTYTDKDGLSSPLVIALQEDADLNLWIGTYRGGLNLYREGRFSSLSARNGLPAETVYAVLIDDTDRIWFSTEKGIFYVARRPLIAYLDGAGSVPPIGAIGLSDGLRTLECTGGVQPAAVKARNGLLYFPTIKGLVVIDPRNVPQTPEVPNTYIASLTIGDERSFPGPTLTLSPERNSFSVGFGAAALRRDRPFTYRYKLEGIDPDWKESQDGAASYLDLPPGDYALLATAMTGAGTPGTAARLDITVTASHTPILLLGGAAILLLAGGIVLLLRRRQRPVARPLELIPDAPRPPQEPKDQARRLPEELPVAPEPLRSQEAHKEAPAEIPPAEPAPPRPRYEKSRLDDDTARIIVATIVRYMDEKKPYKDPDLTLANLADRLDLTPHLLSQLLNDRLSKNFNMFINEYRVAEVKAMLDDPANRDKLLAIAYDAGFRSKTTFNTIFKKCTGRTPREYRKNLDGIEMADSDEMPD